MQLYFFETKLPDLKLKTQLKQLLGSPPIVIALPGQTKVKGDFVSALYSSQSSFAHVETKPNHMLFLHCLPALRPACLLLILSYLLACQCTFLRIYMSVRLSVYSSVYLPAACLPVPACLGH
jgi:hypothetical protein